MQPITIHLFGSYEVSVGNTPFDQFGTKKVKALLAYLIVEDATSISRDTLMDLLWPGLPQASAQVNLRQILYRLRQAFTVLRADVPPLLREKRLIQLNPALVISADIHTFDHLLNSIETHSHAALHQCEQCQTTLDEALAVYRGTLLQDFFLEDSSVFEAWAGKRRATYLRQFLDALTLATDVQLQLGNFARAEERARQQLAADELREVAHRQLIQTLAERGHRADALTHFELCKALYERELAMPVSAETQALADAIRTNTYQPIAQEVVPIAAPATPPTHSPQRATKHNLPIQPTLFVGRERELAHLDHLIANADRRLITIVAPGGMGKTRLALAAAERQLETGRFTHGIFFIDLAPLDEVTQIMPALIDALNVPSLRTGEPDATVVAVQNYLQNKQMLLLFDNFEHLLDGADLLVAIVQTAANIQIVVTSRERLGLRAEHVYTIDGLEFPDWETPEDAAQYTAVQLFLQSARQNDSSFSLRGADDLPCLARICRLVAGMPLAIEMAAGWVDMLSLEEISAEIQAGLDSVDRDSSQ